MRSPDHPPSQRRRRLLRAGGALAAAGLAGCQLNFGTELSERSERTVDLSVPSSLPVVRTASENGGVTLRSL